MLQLPAELLKPHGGELIAWIVPIPRAATKISEPSSELEKNRQVWLERRTCMIASQNHVVGFHFPSPQRSHAFFFFLAQTLGTDWGIEMADVAKKRSNWSSVLRVRLGTIASFELGPSSPDLDTNSTASPRQPHWPFLHLLSFSRIIFDDNYPFVIAPQMG